MKRRIISIFLTLMVVAGFSIVAALPARPVLAADYTLTINGSAGGTVINPGEDQTFTYAAGTVVNLIATPSTGYYFSSWIGDVTTVANLYSATTTIRMDGNYSIAAYFVSNASTITASAGANGTISPVGSVAVTYGGSQTFTITPDAGYRISDVLVDGVSAGAVASYTFYTVTAGHTIVASFAVNNFGITATAGANGTVTPAGTTSVTYGTNQAYAITPATGYHITAVTVDGASVGVVSTYTFTNVVAAHTITATFAINTYTITASAGANGVISPSGAATINYGGGQTYVLTPNTGYHVNAVSVDGAPAGALTSYSFSGVTGDHTISATFAVTTYTIAASAADHGLVAPAGTTTINYGGTQTYTFTPATGYHVANVLVDGAFVGAVASYPFTNVTASHTVAVSFAINTYTITPTAGPNGVIAPFSPTMANHGDNQMFTIKADGAYRITDVKVDGVSKGAITSYTFTNITANHTIEATFGIGLPFYAAMGIGVLLVFLLGYLLGKTSSRQKI